MAATDAIVEVLVGEQLGDPQLAHVHAVQLPSTPDAPQQARLFAWSVGLPLPSDDMALLSLLTSELVTNALLHARTEITYGTAVTDDVVLVVVADGYEVLPTLSAEGGRGLQLVASLALSWGTCRVLGGKAVWFTLRRPRSPAQASP